jgi:hypothetical protein
MSKIKPKKTRREFLKSCARTIAVSTLGVLGGGLLLRKSDNKTDTCINEYLCNGCRVFSNCNLPQAKAVRKTNNP